MNQTGLINAISQKLTADGHDLPDTQIRRVLIALGATAGEVLARGDDLTLPGIGRIHPVQRAERAGRNPKTGEPITIPAKTIAKLTPSKALNDQLT